MENTQNHGVVHGGVVVLRNGANSLKDGTKVIVRPVPESSGLSSSVIAAVECAPQVSPAWVDELDDLIAQGRRLPLLANPLVDENDESERG